MKIQKIKIWKENLELTKPYTVAYHTMDTVENLFVYLEAENGLYGIGSGSPSMFVTKENINESLATLNDTLEDLLKGKDLRHLNAHLQILPTHFSAFPAARAAIDIALHDLFTKYLEIPMIKYLGRSHRGLLTSITIGIKSLEETLEEGEEYVKNGFKIIKLKTGQEVEKDIAVFSKLREKVGPHIKIRIDANQGYAPEDLLHFIQQTQSFDVEFLEQPFPPGKLDKMLQLPINVRKQCAADEDLHSPKDAIKMAVAPQPYGVYNIKLMKCGGINPALQIAQTAHLHQIDLMWGCMDESIISITAALNAAMASPATRYLDLDGSLDLARDIVKGGFILKDGALYTNDRPGLGVEIL